MSPVNALPLPQSYSHLEQTLARRLQRRSLEIAYRMCSDRCSDPQVIYRKFRLVQCFRDLGKMLPGLHGLLRRSDCEPLELFGLPFYCIGDAGKHYSRPNPSDVASHSQNVRLPRRILGLGQSGFDCSVSSYEEKLATLGYDGEWYDSYETEQYLSEKGIRIGAFSNWHENMQIDRLLEGMHYVFPFDIESIAHIPTCLALRSQSQALAAKAVFLGRAPGYKRSELDCAIGLLVHATHHD